MFLCASVPSDALPKALCTSGAMNDCNALQCSGRLKQVVVC